MKDTNTYQFVPIEECRNKLIDEKEYHIIVDGTHFFAKWKQRLGEFRDGSWTIEGQYSVLLPLDTAQFLQSRGYPLNGFVAFLNQHYTVPPSVESVSNKEEGKDICIKEGCNNVAKENYRICKEHFYAPDSPHVIGFDDSNK